MISSHGCPRSAFIEAFFSPLRLTNFQWPSDQCTRSMLLVPNTYTPTRACTHTHRHTETRRHRYGLKKNCFNIQHENKHNQVGEGKTATLRIEAPEGARKPATTIGVDPRHPLTGGLEVDFDGELSLGRGKVRQAAAKAHPLVWSPLEHPPTQEDAGVAKTRYHTLLPSGQNKVYVEKTRSGSRERGRVLVSTVYVLPHLRWSSRARSG